MEHKIYKSSNNSSLDSTYNKNIEQFGIENYWWKVDLFQKMPTFLPWYFEPRISGYVHTKIYRYNYTKICWLYLKAICIIRILGHFDADSYTWRVGAVQNFSKYCRFFSYDFLVPNHGNNLNTDTTEASLILLTHCLYDS